MTPNDHSHEDLNRQLMCVFSSIVGHCIPDDRRCLRRRIWNVCTVWSSCWMSIKSISHCTVR